VHKRELPQTTVFGIQMDAETLSYAVQRGLITPCAEDAPLPRLQCLPSPDPEDVMQTRLLPFLQQHAEPYQETWTVTPDQRDAIFGLVTKVTRKATLANLDFDVPALPKPMPVLLEEFRFPRRFWKNKAVVPKKWKAPPKLVPIDLAPLEEACLAAEGKLPSIDDLLYVLAVCPFEQLEFVQGPVSDDRCTHACRRQGARPTFPVEKRITSL
jgi:hypothetical protein